MVVERDQHIVQTEDILEAEIKYAELSKEESVIEIGAGPGNLTRKLAKHAKKVLAFEIDQKFEKELKRLPKNVTISYKNALDESWEGYKKIVANIPYTLSEPILWKAIQEGIEILVLIVSQSFKETILDAESNIGYRSQQFFRVEPLLFVPRTAFSPKPKTDSWVIRLTKKEQTPAERMIGEAIVSRKKTKNAILAALTNAGKTKNQAREIIGRMKLEKKESEESPRKITVKTWRRIESFINKKEKKEE